MEHGTCMFLSLMAHNYYAPEFRFELQSIPKAWQIFLPFTEDWRGPDILRINQTYRWTQYSTWNRWVIQFEINSWPVEGEEISKWIIITSHFHKSLYLTNYNLSIDATSCGLSETLSKPWLQMTSHDPQTSVIQRLGSRFCTTPELLTANP